MREVFSVDPLLLVPLLAVQRIPEAGVFYRCGPSFPHSFLIGTPTRAALAVLVGHARCQTICAMDPLLLMPLFTGQEVLEFWKHGKAADWCFYVFGQHRDPVGAQVAEESGPI